MYYARGIQLSTSSIFPWMITLYSGLLSTEDGLLLDLNGHKWLSGIGYALVTRRLYIPIIA